MNAPATKPEDPLGKALAKLGGLLAQDREQGGLTPGEHAELRRMGPGAALPPAFWRLLARNDVGEIVESIREGDLEDAEWALAVAIRAMAEIGGVGGDASLGEALAESGYAEARFVRFLRARGRGPMAHEAGLVARWLATNGIRLRPDDPYRRDGFTPFVLHAVLGSRWAEGRAHAIARSYFAAEGRPERPATTSTETGP